MSTRPTYLRIHQFAGLAPGKRLIVLGAVHGNETCGTRAIERVVSEIERGEIHLVRGTLTLVPITNPLAYQLGRRIGDRNLNRNLRPDAVAHDFEDLIANQLCPLLARHEVLLDLHSFHTGGQPFAMLGPQNNTGTLEPFAHQAEEEALALSLGPKRIVEGWLDTYSRGVARRLAESPAELRQNMLSTDPSYGVGTTEYMRSQGGYSVTLECGQHDDPQAPEVAYRAIRNTLALLGLIDEAAPEKVHDPEVLHLAEVTDRYHPDDHFARPWASFDPLAAGELIGTRHDGTELRAPEAGFIVFPNPGATPGNEWFYFAGLSHRLAG